MTIPGPKIFQTSLLHNFDSIQLFEMQNFVSRFGVSDPLFDPTYSVVIDPDNLFFSVKIPETRNFDKSLNTGQFKPDLWKHDVVEIFFASDKNCATQSSTVGQDCPYQEFNVSPAGAYWTVKFSAYRSRIPGTEEPVTGLQVESRSTITGKILSIMIPKNNIINQCSLGNNSRINCCAILGNEPRTYFSTAALDNVKPDFHHIESWGEARIYQR